MKSQLIGKYVLVRTFSAGVHSGILDEKEGQEVRLTNARRLWFWKPANDHGGTLSGVAVHGVGDGSRVAGPVEVIELTEAIEVIAVSDTARESIDGQQWINE